MEERNNNNFAEHTDEELMCLFIRENVKAFDELVRRYKSGVLNYLFKLTGDYYKADDIAQESFIRLYKYKDSYIEGTAFRPWFYTIVINLSKNSFRKSPVREFVSINDMNSTQLEKIEYYADPDADENSDDLEYQNGLKAEIIRKAFYKLDDVFREVILLRFEKEFEYEKIAEMLCIPVGTVKSRINRGRKQLMEILKSECHER